MLDRDNHYYGLIKVIIKEEKRDKQMMKKLIIGTIKFNILVTCSLLLSPANGRFVTTRLSCHESVHYLNPHFTQILFRESPIKSFYDKQTVPRSEVTACGQLMSAYDHKSTYSIYRYSVFASPVMQKSSIFTVCNVPSKEYDMSMNYNARLVSVFFSKYLAHG